MFAVNDLKKRKPTSKTKDERRVASGENKQKCLHTYKIKSSSFPPGLACWSCSVFSPLLLLSRQIANNKRKFTQAVWAIDGWDLAGIPKKKNQEMCVALAVVDLILIASMNINTQERQGEVG